MKAFVIESSNPFECLRSEYARLASRFPESSSRPCLYGIPVAVKDIFNVKWFPTQAGSRLPSYALAGREPPSVAPPKSVRALVRGKTTTAEFDYRAPGPPRNAHNLYHTPGGSSSGSAVAVAAGLCLIALDTQTIGSLLRPPSYCGVVDFKPIYGRISKEVVIPLAPSADHVGFFTPDVEGAMPVASVLCRD